MPPPFAPRTILLHSADGRDVLRLTSIRRDAGYPSLEVRVEGRAKGFSGGADVWIDGFDLKAFTAALRALERSGQGTVELRSMTPDELRLGLRAPDGRGHLLVEFAIARTVRVGDRPERVPVRVSGAFELDPGTVGELVVGFEQLAKVVAA
jgi:hypothetical protein